MYQINLWNHIETDRASSQLSNHCGLCEVRAGAAVDVVKLQGWRLAVEPGLESEALASATHVA